MGTGLCTAAVLGSCGVAPRGVSVPAVWPQPWQCLLMQLLSFSLASPAAPGAKHHTSPSCRLSAVSAAFCIQPPAEAALLLHRSSWGTPSGFYSPSPAARSPNTTLLRLRHVWGWHSLAAPQGAAVSGHTSQQSLLLGTHLGHRLGSHSH